MTDTEKPMNGNSTNAANDSDDDDPSKLRPVNIEQDVREMERRKRVDAIMSSKMFREELERVVSDSLRETGADGISSMLSEMLHVKPTGGGGAFRGASSYVPINDIRGLEGMGYTKHEKQLRCKLAAAYRLVDMFGWSQSIYNHISLRISQDTEHFLINPFGMLYNEITASSLVKVNMQGQVVESGTTNFGVNVAGFMLHSAIHANRPDLKCVLHVHTPSVVAVSAMKCGLLPLSQEACLLGDVSYHTYQGLVVDAEERDTLYRDLGVHNKNMLLRNHGAVCCGETLEEAFHYAYHLILACDTQLKMMPMGLDNLVTIDDSTRRKVFELSQKGGGGVNSKAEGGPDGSGEKRKRVCGVGELEFEALMRMLDNAGFRTGYIYKNPLVKDEPAKLKSDVELPPAVSSLGYLLEEENLYKDGPLRALLSGYAKQATKGAGRTKWMNSPNVYQKVEILETGTPDPKKITKWVADGSPSKSTPIKVESPNQFVPLGTHKREFKKIQQAMKEGRRAGGITAGPESKVLDGAVWEERAESVNRSFGMDHVDYKVGAASKGIIQRDYQHNATVYKSVYAKNPFDNVSSEELAEYQRIVDLKSRGENPISPGPGGDYTYGDTTGEIVRRQQGYGGAGSSSAAAALLSPLLSPTTDTEHDGFLILPPADSREQQQQQQHPKPIKAAAAKFNTLPKAAGPPKKTFLGENGDHTYNGDETDGNRTFSEGEGDTSRATDPDSSPKKEKKKKSGLRTPSFLKKKKKEKTAKKA